MLEFLLGLLEIALELGALTWRQFLFVAATAVVLIVGVLISPDNAAMGCLALAATALGLLAAVKWFFYSIN